MYKKSLAIIFLMILINSSCAMQKEIVFDNREQQIRETIDLSDPEPIIQTPFAELIQQETEKSLPFILARVVTNVGDKPFSHYYDVQSLHEALYSGRNENRYDSASPTLNPLNRQPIINAIHYFTIRNITKSFEHLCSDLDLFSDQSKKDLFQLIFRAHDILMPGNHVQQPAAQMYLGQMYYFGNGVDKDYQIAQAYFKQAAQQDENPEVKANAQMYLGQMYYLGHGVYKDYQKAQAYFQQAVQQNVNPVAKAEAQMYLGQIYYFAHGVDKDYQQAREFFQQVQDVSPEAKANAQKYLNKIDRDRQRILATFYRNRSHNAKNCKKSWKIQRESERTQKYQLLAY